MKPKVFSKKLKLNKKTIADLKGSEMKEVYGGDTAPGAPTCDTCLCRITYICPPTYITNNSEVQGQCCIGCVS